MEGNRDEAKRCIDIAYKYLRAGDLDRARKFLVKAEKLYPSVQGQKLLDEIKALKEEGAAAHEEDPPSQDEEKYTQEQVDLVKRVKKCKTFYEMLGVTKDTTETEIRKAYKKLALQLHPDKNRAPGAAEAFKAVGNAVAVLTDAEKRKSYDLFGGEVPSRNTRHRHHNQDYYRQFESDATAEELFNMFFGDGFTHSNHRRFRNHHHHENNQPSLAFGLILILVVISLMSTFLQSDPIYSLQPSTKYSVTKKTTGLGIPYYVKRTFEEEYSGSLARLELSVEEEYLIGMKKLCMRERHYRDAMMSRAQHFGNKEQLAQAQSLKTPSCDELYRIGKFTLGNF
uniref:Putative dnaj molecular chaperone similarity domain protein n=1 Tax=Nyssomyia neivai TaxID=330878 RepID=A0A1L8DU48_9DIPT